MNLEKSSLMPTSQVEDLEGLALELGCKVEELPTTYLGLPLGAPHNSFVLDGVEEGFRKRLVLWKKQPIFGGASLTLIKAPSPICPYTQCHNFVGLRK